MNETKMREEFQAKADELGRVLDSLRPGTGPGVATLVMMAWDESWRAATARAYEKATRLVCHFCASDTPFAGDQHKLLSPSSESGFFYVDCAAKGIRALAATEEAK